MPEQTMTPTYRQQLDRLVHRMALPNQESDLQHALAQPSRPQHVKMFVDGNLEKRLDKLSGQLEFVAAEFEDFESLIMEYIRDQPLAALDNGIQDGDRLLEWLTARRELTPRQQDYVVCQRTRHAIEELARRDRLAYVRFHERLSLVDEFIDRIDEDPQLQIYLNPIRRWARFVTPALLDRAAEPPANVLFFGSRGEVASAVLELEGQTLINELADLGPCSLAEWAALTQLVARPQLVEFCQDLAEMGLVCFG